MLIYLQLTKWLAMFLLTALLQAKTSYAYYGTGSAEVNMMQVNPSMQAPKITNDNYRQNINLPVGQSAQQYQALMMRKKMQNTNQSPQKYSGLMGKFSKFLSKGQGNNIYNKSAVMDVKARNRFAVLDRKRFQVPGDADFKNTKQKQLNLSPFNIDSFYTLTYNQSLNANLSSNRFYDLTNGAGFLINSFGFEFGYAKRVFGNKYSTRLAGIDKSALKFNNIQNLRDPNFALKKHKQKPSYLDSGAMFFTSYGLSVNYYGFKASNPAGSNEVDLEKRLLIATPNVKLLYFPKSTKFVLNMPKYGALVSQLYMYPELGLSLISYSNTLTFDLGEKQTNNSIHVKPLLGFGAGMMTDITRLTKGDKSIFINIGASYKMMIGSMNVVSQKNYFNESLKFNTTQLNLGCGMSW
jgi:hypothetical protein